jgi:hypothetical protein
MLRCRFTLTQTTFARMKSVHQDVPTPRDKQSVKSKADFRFLLDVCLNFMTPLHLPYSLYYLVETKNSVIQSDK